MVPTFKIATHLPSLMSTTPLIRNINIFAWAQERKEEVVISPTPIYEGNGFVVMNGDYRHAIEQACYQRPCIPLDPVLM